ncbi:MAG TPA: hypothetical protein PKK51_09265, partial [Rhodocyclaceae bacterium]|nr:hypothetical protein [Rhodocyclaceae bacterium]
WTRRAISPRLAMRIFSNISGLRGEIALVAWGHGAVWLRRCAARSRLVAPVGDGDLLKHSVGVLFGL